MPFGARTDPLVNHFFASLRQMFPVRATER